MTQRKLAAIMFTDIVGYTALMGSDEDKAFQVLRKNREIHTKFIKKFNGTLIKEMGDGMLISFNSASEAVRCAIEIQKGCKNENISIKIGINEGEIVLEGTDLWGDVVNIASRLEQATEQGGISISGVVYNDVKNKPGIIVEFVEEKSFKGVEEPVRIYKVLCGSTSKKPKSIFISEKAPVEKSIIVLPFENMSPDPDQEYFSDGLTEEIITDLSHIRDLLVISRNSAMTFKNTKINTKEIASEVNVRYVLEGSVRKSGNNLRITAQLIDGQNDTHLWADKYNGLLDDVFDIQEKVSRSIVETLKIKLSCEENNQLSSHPSSDIQAYEAYLKGMVYVTKLDQPSVENAKDYFELAIQIDPEFAMAHFGLAFYWAAKLQGGYISHKEGNPKLEEELEKALSLGSISIEGHSFLAGLNYACLWKWEVAEREYLNVLQLNPNHARTLAGYSHYLATVGKPNEALPFVEKAYRLEKMDPFIHGQYGMSLRHAHKYNEAIEILEKAAIKFPGEMIIYSTLRSAYHDKNRFDEAIKAGTKYYEIRGDCYAIIEALENGYKEGGYQLALQRNAEALIAKSETEYITPWQVATIYTRAGLKEDAIEWLEKAYNVHDNNMTYLTADPIFDYLREDPRFQKLVEKMNLPK
jgi:TolB-like protein/class 3 adenylate cyclase